MKLTKKEEKIIHKKEKNILYVCKRNKSLIIFLICIFLITLFGVFLSVSILFESNNKNSNKIINEYIPKNDDFKKSINIEENIDNQIVEKEVIKEKVISDKEKMDLVLSNTLQKRVDFINKMIVEFNLNKYSQNIYYMAENNVYNKITPKVLLSMSINQLYEVNIEIQQYGIFEMNSNGEYVKAKK